MEDIKKYINREIILLISNNNEIIYYKGILKNIYNNSLILEDKIISIKDIIAISSCWTKEMLFFNPEYEIAKRSIWNVEQSKRIIKEDLIVEWNNIEIDPFLKTIVRKFLEKLANDIPVNVVYNEIAEEYDDIEFIELIERLIIRYSPKGDEYLNYFKKEKEEINYER